MANQISQFKVNWTAAGGLPGYSTFYANLATPSAANCALFAGKLRTFFVAIASLVPGIVTFQFPGSANVVNDFDGALVNVVPFTPPADASATGNGIYAAASGLYVRWNTGIVYAKHRVVGRTFIVPSMSSAFSTTGAPTSAAVTQLQTAAGTLISSAATEFCVWSRPVTAAQATPTTPARDGLACNIASASVTGKGTVLRSRRD